MHLELKNITKKFGKITAVDDVSFEIEKGELVALLGPSGSGKTTILRIIAGLECGYSGEVRINGRNMDNISPQNRGIGFVFQNYALFRHMNIADNISFGLAPKRLSKNEIKRRTDELMSLMGLSGLEHRYPNELSGGQKQRVAFARALAPSPEMLLLDEPFAALDTMIRRELRKWLRDTIHDIGITSVFVTHDQEEAVEIADRIIVMNHGKMEQIGTPYEIYTNPETKFVSSFIGENIVVNDCSIFRGFEGTSFKGAVIRPEFIEAFKDDNSKFQNVLEFADKGVIKDILFHGNSYEVILDVKGVELKTFRSLERRDIRVGEVMNVIIYRMYAYDGNRVCLLENSFLRGDVKKSYIENHLYGSDGYFVG